MAVVGIDLGTTNTVVACVRGGRVHVLADEQGRRLLPSVVSFHPSGDVLVGYPAKERRVVDAKNTIASVKRLIGRAWDSDEIRRARPRFPFELKEGPGQGPLVAARGQEYTLPEISAFVLKRAKQLAEHALGEPVDRAVVTVPANFNELQRAATKVAGRVAGLDVMRIINEPTAVYDFGGGTFDCTLLDLSGNVFEVLATAGDSFLGGDDLDLAVAERMSEAFLLAHRYDPRTDPQAFERLRVAGEAIKIELSISERSQTKLREVAFGVGGAHLGLDFGMTRDELEMLATPLVERTFAVCQEALSVAGLPVTSFDKVLLVGGSTRIPLVRRRVEQFFGTPPLDRVNADEVVAIGAAIQAAALTEVARRRSIPPPPMPAVRKSIPPAPSSADDEITISNQVSAEIAHMQKARLAGRPPLPAAALRMPDAPTITAAPEAAADPTETIPLPAALRDGALGPSPGTPAPPPPVLVDVTPRALVVETVGGWCDVVVQRNAKIPCERRGRTPSFATTPSSGRSSSWD